MAMQFEPLTPLEVAANIVAAACFEKEKLYNFSPPVKADGYGVIDEMLYPGLRFPTARFHRLDDEGHLVFIGVPFPTPSGPQTSFYFAIISEGGSNITEAPEE